MLREIDYMAIDAANNQDLLNSFTEQNELFILKCTSRIIRKYITKSDDEWSVSLQAFVQAIQCYELSKGNFLSFAELIIRRRLIDYLRLQKKYSLELSVNPAIFNCHLDENEDDKDIALGLAVAEKVCQKDNYTLKFEIEAANEVFSHYGFSFLDLSTCSPKAKKTKLSCAKVVIYLLSNPLLINELQSSKQLPLKIIEKNLNVPRKILERHRKYIIAAVEILSGEYLNLAYYFRYIREEITK
ncbi:hypothetical protein [uncultured Clostridium sp.]|uniref:hypothetical protein n=1 Tax=uncultured Clostridium sp. TaxID=59620 RepID=UPI0032175814